MSEGSASGESGGLGGPDQRGVSAVLPAAEPGTVPGRLRVDRRLLAGVGAVVTIVVLAIVVVVSRGPDGPGSREDLNVGSLATPKTTRDPVPTGPIITKYPAACGVPKATLLELLPGSSDPGGKEALSKEARKGDCFWSDTDLPRKERVLDVVIVLNKAPGDAIRQIDPAAAVSRAVSGLGEDAWATYSSGTSSEGAHVRFRVGNAYVSVKYGDLLRQLPEKTAMPRALKTAAEIARNLGMPSRSTPSFTLPRETTQPIRRIPNPCDTVSEETVRKVANGAYRERGLAYSTGPFPRINRDSCRWTARTPHSPESKKSARHLEVTTVMPADGQPVMATHIATREYLLQHHDARDGRQDSPVNRQDGFTVLSGLGEQAFAVYGKYPDGDSEPGGCVVFRLRNVLVQVRYHADSQDQDPLTMTEAINGAYTVALDVAHALRRP